MIIDSHAHLNFPDFAENLEKIIADAQSAGVGKIINIGTSLKDSQDTIVLAQKYPSLYASVGIHPNDDPAATVENVDWEKFEKLAGLEKVVAIGECGLDYSRIKNEDIKISNQEIDRQKSLFSKQIGIAQKLSLPLSIHIRDAQKDIMEEFEGLLQNSRGVFHCFSGDLDYLNFILEKLPGFYVSFAGNITFKNSGSLQQLLQGVPLQRLLVETDCPFLAPEPYRGTQNRPANVKITSEKLAEVQGVSFERIAEATSANACALFKIS